MSNLTFSMIMEHFFHFLAYIIQLFPMNLKLSKGQDTIVLTYFLCSFTWWGSHAGLSWARWTFGMIYEEKSKFSPKNWWKCPVIAYPSAYISNLTPDLKNSGNFGPGNTLLTQHLVAESTIGYAKDFNKITPKMANFSCPSTHDLGCLAHLFKIWPNVVLAGS